MPYVVNFYRVSGISRIYFNSVPTSTASTDLWAATWFPTDSTAISTPFAAESIGDVNVYNYVKPMIHINDCIGISETTIDLPNIPKGSKLIGKYESHNVHDQRLQNLRYPHIERCIAVWFTRIICPNGASILLSRPVDADLQEQTGVEKNIDSHLKRIVDAATISTIIRIGMGSTGINGAADMPPTITLSPGCKFTVSVKKNMILTPYKAGN